MGETREVDKALKLFQQRYDSIASTWNKRQMEYKKNYQRMLAQDVGPAKPFGAKVNTQHTHTQVMTHTAFVLSGLMPTYPWVYCEANEPYRDIESRGTEEINRRLRQVKWYRINYFYLREADKCGVGIMKMTMTEEGPFLKVVDAANIAWDPEAEDLRYDAQWVIERYKNLTADMLKQMAREGMFSREKVDEVIRSGEGGETERDERRVIRFGEDHGIGDDGDKTFTLFDLVMPDRIITVHKGSEVVLRDDENPYGYIYYYDTSNFPETFEVEGYGIPELGADIQDEIDTSRRQRIDARSFIANPVIKMKRSTGASPFGHVVRPGAVFQVDEADDLSAMVYQDQTAPLMQEEQNLIREFDRLVGVMPMSRGEQGTQMKATTANILHGNLSLRFAVKMNLMREYPFRAILDDFLQLSILDDEPMAITQVEWDTFVNLVEQGHIWLVPHTEAYVGNATEKYQLLANILQYAQGVLQPQGIGELFKEMLQLIQVRDPERITRWLMPPASEDLVSGQQTPQQGEPGMMSGQGRGVGVVGEQARAMAPAQSPGPVGVPV